MCAPGCIERVGAKLSRRGFFRGAGAVVAGIGAASLVAPKIKGATGGPTRVLALI